MAAMSNLQKHPKSGVYRINKRIPEAAQSAFGGRKVFLKSLQTKDLATAKRKALSVLAELQDRIDRVLSGSVLLDPQDMFSAKIAFVRHADWYGKIHNPESLRREGEFIYPDRAEFQSDLDRFAGDRFAEHEIHEAVLSCTKARRDVLLGLTTTKPRLH